MNPQKVNVSGYRNKHSTCGHHLTHSADDFVIFCRLKEVKFQRPPPFIIKILHLGVTLNVCLAINDHPRDMQPTHSRVVHITVVNVLELKKVSKYKRRRSL